MIVSLTGFMGCGKSSVGKELASLYRASFIDLDDFIEEKEGMRIEDIFASKGEKYFREKEKEALECALKSFSDGGPDSLSVLSLGGGALKTSENARMIKEHTFCIYLCAGVDTLLRNLEKDDISSRPLLRGCKEEALKQQIASLLSEREEIYRSCASLVVDTNNKSIREIAEEITKEIAGKSL